MKANFDVSAIINKVRIEQVTFLGKCRNCDKTINVSSILSVTHKQLLLRRYGIVRQDGKIVCKKVLDIDYCRTCASANIG